MPKGKGYPRGKGKKKPKMPFHGKKKKMSNLFKKGKRGR